MAGSQDRRRGAADAAAVTICLALHQGGRHIAAQLDSIAGLEGDWRLIVSDDASRDNGPAQVQAFAARQPPGRVRLIAGPARGAAANFLHLIAAAPDGTLAFCDQDDVWLPQRLSLGLGALAGQDGPAVHLGRTLVCHHDLSRPVPGPPHRRRPGFANALVQAGGPGNAMTLNPAAVALLRAGLAAAQAARVPAHDWWVYQLVTGAGGAWLTDEAPTLLYRQHDANVMGRNDTIRARLQRAAGLIDGTFADWLARNQAALEGAADLLTPPNRALLEGFRAALARPGPLAAMALRRLRVARDTAAGTGALLASAAAGRLRPPR